jgi:hypothetical protein
VYLRNYTIDTYSFQYLQTKGIEEAGAGQSSGKISPPDYSITLDLVGNTIITLSGLGGPEGLAVGSIVGLPIIGAAAALKYVQGQQVSKPRYTEAVQGDNHWQLTAKDPISLDLGTSCSTPKSESDLIYLKFQSGSAHHCGMTEVVLKGTLAA